MLQRIDYAGLTRGLLARGHTTASLARAVGLSQPSVSRIATGRTQSVSGEVALRLIQLAGGKVTMPVSVGPAKEGVD